MHITVKSVFFVACTGTMSQAVGWHAVTAKGQSTDPYKIWMWPPAASLIPFVRLVYNE